MTTLGTFQTPATVPTLPAPSPALTTGRASATPCQCESKDCSHRYLAVPAECGTICDGVGAVCAHCGSTHLRPYMISVQYEVPVP